MLEGTLGVVLRVSRIFGVFPLCIKGTKLSVSLPLAVCAKMFAVAMVIVHCVVTVDNFLFYEFKRSTFIFDLLRIFANIITVITLLIVVFTSPQRTIRYIRILQKLDEMDKEVLENKSKNNSETKLTIFVLLFILITLVLRGYNFIYYIFNEKSLELKLPIFLIILYVALLMINLTEVQVSLLARRTKLSLKVINNTLEHLCRIKSTNDNEWSRPRQKIFVTTKRVNEIHSTTGILKQDNSGDTPYGKQIQVLDKKPVKLIRKCIKNYLSICNIITDITRGDGVVLGILIFYHIFYLLSNSYKIITFSLSSIYEEANMYIAIYSALLHAITMTCCVEPYHETETEMQKLQFLLRTMKWINIDKTEIRNELNLFWSIMCLNKATYSPLGMFTLNRMFVLKVFGSLITYMVIIFTYGPN